jgi:hypothetical protein
VVISGLNTYCLYDAALCNALYCPMLFTASLHFAKHTKYASKHAKVNFVHPNMPSSPQ